MNRSAMVSSVYNRTGVLATDGIITPTIVGQFVNDANHAIEVMEDWPWLLTSGTFSTIAGVQSYPITALFPTWLRTSEVLVAQTDGTNWALNHLGGRELDDRYPNSVLQIPQAWTIRGDAFQFGPTPDAAYQVTHWYYRQEPDLNQDTDTPIMPASFHAAIVELACALTLRRVQQEGRATAAESEFTTTWLPRLQAHRRRFTGPIRVRVRSGYMGP